MKFITRFAGLRLGVLIGVLGIGFAIHWTATHPKPFGFSDETFATFNRIEAMLPEPSEEATTRWAKLGEILVELDRSFFTEDGEIASWLNYDDDKWTYSLVDGFDPEDLPPAFHQAVANLLNWHERDRAPVPIFSSQVDLFSLALQNGILSQENILLILSVLPTNEADEVGAALAHAAYFSWTVATGIWDVLLAKIIWEALDSHYPKEDQRSRIRGEWRPDSHPQAFRLARLVLNNFLFATMIPGENLIVIYEIDSGKEVEDREIEEGYAVKLSTTEQILLGFERGDSKEEIDELLQVLRGNEPSASSAGIYSFPLWLSDLLSAP